MSNKYNGYANWDTWNVELWIDNEECIYDEKVKILRRDDVDADQVEAFCIEYLGETTPDDADYKLVDWEELADMWNHERREDGYLYEEEEVDNGI